METRVAKFCIEIVWWPGFVRSAFAMFEADSFLQSLSGGLVGLVSR